MNWPLQDAKNKFSEVVNRTLTDGPQVITRHGKEVVVVVPVKQYRQMRKRSKGDLVDFFGTSPLVGNIRIARSRDRSTRKVRI